MYDFIGRDISQNIEQITVTINKSFDQKLPFSFETSIESLIEQVIVSEFSSLKTLRDSVSENEFRIKIEIYKSVFRVYNNCVKSSYLFGCLKMKAFESSFHTNSLVDGR